MAAVRLAAWAGGMSAVLTIGLTGLPSAGATYSSPTPAWPGVTERVSVATDGEQAAGPSYDADISANGKFLAFTSAAPNLVQGDHNGKTDVFLRNLTTGRVKRVSLGPHGREAARDSREPVLSATGRYVAFTSEAGKLVRGDTNRSWDVFVHDRRTHRTSRVSTKSNGDQVFGNSWNPSISGDGRIVAFESWSDQLVPNDTNDYVDVFVHNQLTDRTVRASVSSRETEGWYYSYSPSVSANGQFVAFYSLSDNLTRRDHNATDDVYVRNLRRGVTRLVSLGNHGQFGKSSSTSPSISANGRFVAFRSHAGNLVGGDTNRMDDIFVRDRKEATTTRVSIGIHREEADQDSGYPAISNTGRLIAFASLASNWLNGDPTHTMNIFIHNTRLGTTHWISAARRAAAPTQPSISPAISLAGPLIAFSSKAGNLVLADTNRASDVFIRARRK